MKYRQTRGYFAGFVDLRIADIAEPCPEFFEGFALLITCLDSSPDVVTLSRWVTYLKSKEWRPLPIGRAVFIPAENTGGLLEDRQTFFGFDEVYLLKEELPRELPHPTDRAYTTDGFDFGESVPDAFWRYFANVGAVRYVSDGVGLNFACESRGCVQRLERLERELRATP